MNHILGRHGQLDRSPQRHVQLVDLALPFRMLDLPHPLLAGDENLHRSRGRLRVPEVQARTPYEHHCDDHCGNRGPQNLERQGPSIALGRSSGERRRYLIMK